MELQRPLEFEIRCPVQLEVLPALRCMVTALCQQMGFDDECTDQVEMAVDEACANVIRHAYKHLGVSPDLPEDERAPLDKHEGCHLWLRIQLADAHLKISVVDTGAGLPANPRSFTSVEEFQQHGGGSGGLGLLIIRNFMDEVDYHCPGDSGTVLTMIKYLRKGAVGPHS